MEQQVAYRHEFEVMYYLTVGGYGRRWNDETKVPALQGLEELTNDLEKIRDATRQLEGPHTRVSAALNNSELYLIIETNEDPLVVLRRLIDRTGKPNNIYASAEVVDFAETMLNSSYGLTTHFSKATIPARIGRIDRWFLKSRAKQFRKPDDRGKIRVNVYKLG